MRTVKPTLLSVIISVTLLLCPLQVSAVDDMLRSPPDLVGEVSQLHARHLVVADRTIQLDSATRVENRSGLILSQAQVRLGRTVAVYLRNVNMPGKSVVQRLILLK